MWSFTFYKRNKKLALRALLSYIIIIYPFSKWRIGPSGFRNHNVLWGQVIGLTPNPQPGGPRFFCRGFPSLSHRFRLFEGAEHSPFATVAQLLATANITRGYENEDVRRMTSLAEPILDGKVFLSIYGESIGDPC